MDATTAATIARDGVALNILLKKLLKFKMLAPTLRMTVETQPLWGYSAD